MSNITTNPTNPVFWQCLHSTQGSRYSLPYNWIILSYREVWPNERELSWAYGTLKIYRGSTANS